MSDPALAERAVQLAADNVSVGGKPFACLIVDADTGDVLLAATNQVAQRGDPRPMRRSRRSGRRPPGGAAT